MSRRPEFRQLEIFLKVVEAGNFAAAARLLGSTQPAVSQAIARLEDIVGGDLFERGPRSPVALTPIGRAILPSARSLLYTVDHQMSRAIATAQSRSGTLTIGFNPGIASGPLRDGIAQFVAGRPDVHLRLVEALPRELHRRLNERAIDIMFVALLPDLTSAMLVRERLWDEGLTVAIRENHPFASRATLNWYDVSRLSLVMRSSDGDLSAYRAILTRLGERPIDCELHEVSRSALFDMVRMGLGATISFASAVVPQSGIIFLPIEDEGASATIEAVWPRADRNPIRHNLLACVRQNARHSSYTLLR
ncbi:LysR family transcriptional regulator [Sphingomonas paucimobilis]|uniref:LysR family transcriptional regulator n=1 Tax=Sphingomonas paucimobilis TaxID=13689 RepID=UPI000DE2076A|nr:LysR family transcriptional regulator [Sphingomonas paucimobilis]QBE92464.1 LysR family transcriptional regulator [Sphingomonas paucimobilis]